VKSAIFDYERPRDLAEATRMLAAANGAAKALAGGQSLGPMLNLRLARPGLLVDISRLDELKTVTDGGDHWRIGAGVTHARLEDSAGKLPGGEMIVSVAGGIAYRGVRNRGTMGGSLAHADPAADWPLALSALGATVEVKGPRGTRNIAADRLMAGPFTTALDDAELITAVAVPKLSGATRWGYYKFCRKPGEFPDASAACVFDPRRGAARVYIGALDGPPVLLGALAAQIAARPALPDNAALDAAIAGSAPALDAVDRRLFVAVLGRALGQALSA